MLPGRLERFQQGGFIATGVCPCRGCPIQYQKAGQNELAAAP